MYYINLVILTAFLLSSCATTSDSSKNISTSSNPAQTSSEEISQYQKAITLLNNKDYDKAKDILTDFTNNRPELAGPFVNLAVIETEQNNPAQALKLVKLALDKNPKLAQALNLLAYLEQEKGEIQQAVKHYKQAIENKDDYAIAHYNIALLYDVYLQDIDNAILHYERYMKLTHNKDKATADWLEQLKRNKNNG